MNKLNKSIFAALCIALIIAIGYRVRVDVTTMTPKPKRIPTVTIDPELQLRAEKELATEAIFRTAVLEKNVQEWAVDPKNKLQVRAVELKNKLRDRDAFMQECRTQSREQLLQTVEDLARLAGDCEQERRQ